MPLPGDPANVIRLLQPASERTDASAGPRTESGEGTGTQRRTHGRGTPPVHALLERQLREAADANGALQVDELVRLVSRQYRAFESDRSSLETAFQLAADDATPVAEALNEEAMHRLQAIVDYVKDGIITCDDRGRIESMNRTAERYFGVRQSDLVGQAIDKLLPDLAAEGNVAWALDDLACAEDNTHYDLAARETQARHRRGEMMPAEILVSKMLVRQQPLYIICVRDTLERSEAETALRESEARYRVLVENAPEVVVVFDVDSNRFVDCNENAVRFFKMSREQLLKIGPREVSPPIQEDGTESFGVVRGNIDAALAGGTPVFEWLHRDAEGHDIPCEVRLVRLQNTGARLLRTSIIDITDRKRLERIARGERRVFELIASNADIGQTLVAITDVVERALPQSICCIRLYDEARNVLLHRTGPNLPREYVALMDEVPAEIRYGSCAAAIALQRQIIVPDIRADAFWEYRREAALRVGLQACWSTPIRYADGRLLGTFATYLRRTGLPSRRDFELMSRMTQLSRIAIERSRAEDALRESEARYRGLFENVVEGVYQVTLDGELLAANPALIQMLGYESIDDLRAAGPTSRLYVNPAERAGLLARLMRDGELVEVEYRLRRKDGTVIVVSENARVNRDAKGAIVAFEGTITDVTERKRAELRLFAEKERAEVTLQSIADAVITTDHDGIIDYLNPIAVNMTGLRASDAVGRPVGDVIKLVTETSHKPIEDPIARAVRECAAVTLSDQTVMIGASGEEIAIQANASPIRDRDGHVAGAVMVFHDVGRERRMKRLLSYQAAHDALTGLINRREFESRLNAALEASRADPAVCHVMVYVDLDQFKVVNDTCGHPAGDQLLRQVTALLQTRVRAADTLARLGGDEFGILLENCTTAVAMRIAEGLRQAIRDYRFVWLDNSLQIGASIGMVEITAATESVAELLAAADVACYSAKDGGRNRVHIYDAESASARHREMRWVSRITSANDEGRLEIVYQPIVPVAANGDKRPHYEMLLRLRDEQGHLVLPDEFIPAAERYNVMSVLDRWVVERTLRELVPSRRDGVIHAPYTVAVNLSGTTLSDQSFLESLIQQLEEHDPTPGVLCFEITETAAIANLSGASYIMRELASRGCLVALDDFGSGLSSFAYLRNLPVDYIKIDGHFVQNVAVDAVDRSMVEAIVQIGRAMGIRTVAERVETQAVYDTLAEIGVGYVQGFLFGRPEPIDKFPRDLTRIC